MRQVPLKMFCVLTHDQGMRREVVGKGVNVAEVEVDCVASSCWAPTRLTRARGATTC